MFFSKLLGCFWIACHTLVACASSDSTRGGSSPRMRSRSRSLYGNPVPLLVIGSCTMDNPRRRVTDSSGTTKDRVSTAVLGGRGGLGWAAPAKQQTAPHPTRGCLSGKGARTQTAARVRRCRVHAAPGSHETGLARCASRSALTFLDVAFQI